MRKDLKTCLAAGLMAIFGQQASAINIEFDYSFDTNNFFNTQVRKDALNAAGTFFGDIIQDNLTAINSGGSNHFNAVFSNPANGLNTTITDFSVGADTLIVYAGGRMLSGNALGVGGPGVFNVSGSTAFFNNAVTRGETPGTSGVQGGAATDFAPWGGSVTFDTGTNWYFDQDVSSSGDAIDNDFFSIALHELGHVLGIGLADSWDNLVSGADFTGVASSAVFSGAVPLSGDLAHWADGTTGLFNGTFQEAAMDPSIQFGTRKLFTDLDLAGLTDVGWEVASVPVPAAMWSFGSGLIGLVVMVSKRSFCSTQA
ncbi:MAG: matrixin family metalloprotease [Thiogranum sp.]